MKVNDELVVLELPLDFGGPAWPMHISLIVDTEHGLTLVDAGVPGQIDLFEEALAKEGFVLDDIKQIIVTHQDIDHIGSLHVLKERTGATVYAYSVEVPYIEGKLRSVKYPSPERLAANPAFAAMLNALERTTVDVAFEDGDVLTKTAGALVIATPGHTLGHISLDLPGSKTLISGDALVASEGQLNGPMEMATPDMVSAMESVKKLAELDVETIVCYHGGLVTEDAMGQLRRVAG